MLTKLSLISAQIALVALGVSLYSSAVFAQEHCPEPASPERAQHLAAQVFNEGEALYERNDCRAIERFQCSFNLFPHASTLFNIGRSAEQCGRFDLAVRIYRSFLDVFPDNVGRYEVAARLRDVESRAAALERRVEPVQTHLATASEPVINSAPAIDIELRSQRQQELARVVPEAAVDVVEPVHRHQPAHHGSRTRIMRIVSWACFGFGGTLTLTGIGLLGGAASHGSKLDGLMALTGSARPVEEDLQDYADEGRSLSVGGWALFGIGTAVIAAGVALILLTRLRWDISNERSRMSRALAG